MHVVALWRYPVKSLLGEHLESVDVEVAGLRGDRSYAIFDRAGGVGLTARRHPEMLHASARLVDDGVEVVLPDGSVVADDAALSDWLGRDVEMRSSDDPRERRYEVQADQLDDTSEWYAFDGSPLAFHDSGRTQVSLLHEHSLRTGGADWDPRRFRANVLLAGGDDDERALLGRTVRVGTAGLSVVKEVDRCVMITRPQPGGIDKDLDVLRTVHRLRGGNLAVGASVPVPGRVSVGDEVG